MYINYKFFLPELIKNKKYKYKNLMKFNIMYNLICNSNIICNKFKKQTKQIYLRSPNNNKIALVNVNYKLNYILFKIPINNYSIIKSTKILYILKILYTFFFFETNLFHLTLYNLKIPIQHKIKIL